MGIKMNTINKITELLTNKDISQKELAKYLGVSESKISEWKSGKTTSYKKHINEIAAFLDVSTDYLLNDKYNFADSYRIEALPDDKIYKIPVFESVSAGFGVSAISDIEGYIPLFIDNPADVPNTLCIRVTGDSMYPKIEDGDTIIVRKQDIVDNGQIAVILIDKEDAVVKKVHYGNNWIELISQNPEYPPRRFEGAEMRRLSIVGLVRQVIKNV